MEERIAMEADAERFTIVAWRHTNPSANSVCRSAKTRNTHSAGESRAVGGLDAENVGARGISRVQRTALVAAQTTSDLLGDHSSRRVSSSTETGRNR